MKPWIKLLLYSSYLCTNSRVYLGFLGVPVKCHSEVYSVKLILKIVKIRAFRIVFLIHRLEELTLVLYVLTIIPSFSKLLFEKALHTFHKATLQINEFEPI